jgi:hypothetical protein
LSACRCRRPSRSARTANSSSRCDGIFRGGRLGSRRLQSRRFSADFS